MSRRNGITEIYQLHCILTLEPCETIEDLLTFLEQRLNKPIKYKNKFYGDYQSKRGREIAAHSIDVLSNRRSSRRPVFTSFSNNKLDPRDNALAKVAHNNLKEDLFKSVDLNSYEKFYNLLISKDRETLEFFFKLYYHEHTKVFLQFPNRTPYEIRIITLVNIFNKYIKEPTMFYCSMNRKEEIISLFFVTIPYDEEIIEYNFLHSRSVSPWEYFVSPVSPEKLNKLIKLYINII